MRGNQILELLRKADSAIDTELLLDALELGWLAGSTGMTLRETKATLTDAIQKAKHFAVLQKVQEVDRKRKRS